MNILISILAFAFAIGLLVTVHEFGHFWVARRLGVKVLRFSVGFGNALWKKTAKDGTEYVIAALPLGGYVKMLDEREGEVAEKDRPYAFNRKPLWIRTAVVSAGPAFNFLFAIIAYWLIFVLGVPGIKPVLAEPPVNTPAAQAGIQANDLLLRVEDEAVATWKAATLETLSGVLDGGELTLLVSRNGANKTVTLDVPGNTRELTEPGALMQGLGLGLNIPPLPPTLGKLAAGTPAAEGGLQAGDTVLALDGTPVSSFRELAQMIRERPAQVVQFRIARQSRGEETILTLPVVIGSHQIDGSTAGFIGAPVQRPENYGAELRAVQQLRPLAALGAGISKTWEISALTLRLLGRMVIGDVSFKNISGPISIAQYAGFTAQVGLVPFLAFLAVISVSLGVLNLLPIPVLDGGHLLWFAVEAVKGSPVSEQTEILGQRVGIALLLVLMSFAFYNDITRLIN